MQQTNTSSGVYIIALRKQPAYCKIGISDNAERRVLQVSTGEWFKTQPSDALREMKELVAGKEKTLVGYEWTPINAPKTIAEMSLINDANRTKREAAQTILNSN